MVNPAHPVRRTLAVISLLAVALIAVAMGMRTTSAATVNIDAGNNYFCSITFDGGVCETQVNAGDTVTWTMSSGTHTVTECGPGFVCPLDGGFDSTLLQQGETYSHTFNTPGSFNYRCELHPSEMKGTIVVNSVATPTPSPTVAASASPSASAAPTATPAVLPQTGGAPSDGVSDVVLAGVSWLLIAGALGGFAIARKNS